MKRIGIVFLLVMFVGAANAAPATDPAGVTKAEQLIRLHSELMVITVTCKTGSRGQDLIRAYTGFTQRNIRQLSTAEHTLSDYYASLYGGDGVSQLDKLRTKLANEVGQQAANMSAPVFCARKRDTVVAMYDSARAPRMARY